MKKITLLFITLAIITNSRSQSLNWTKTIGGTTGDVGAALVVDSNNNTYAVGSFTGTVDLDPGAGVAIFTSTASFYIEKLDSLGNLVWVKKIDASIKSITLDDTGNIYVSGSFSATVDMDPGSGVVNYTALGGTDAFILKLDNSGNYIWAKIFGGTGNKYNQEVVVEPSGVCYCTGHFSGAVDADPGLGVFNLYAGLGEDFYFLKLDASGNFAWAKNIGNSYYTYAKALAVDSAENVYLGGMFMDVCDFDPGSGTYNLGASGGSFNRFISKFDSSGNFVWVKQFIGLEINNFVFDNSGNIIFTGHFSGTVDFDPGPGIHNVSQTGNINYDDFYVAKLDSSGSLIWVKSIGGPDHESGHAVQTDIFNNVYCTGYFKGTADFDPGPGSVNLSSAGANDIFVLKLDPNGNFIFVKQIAGLNDEIPNDLAISQNGHIFLTGFFYGPTDFDPGFGVSIHSTVGQWDAFITQLDHNLCSDITVLFDSVINNGCFSPGFINAHTICGLSPYSYEWNSTPIVYDSSLVSSAEGIYQLTVTDANGCIGGNSIMMHGPSDTTLFDLKVNLVHSIFRVGTPSYLWIDAFNDRCAPVSGQVKLIPDSAISFSSAYPPPDSISGDTLIWNFSNLTFDSTHVRSQISFIPPLGSLGLLLCSTLIVTPISGDVDTTNNSKTYCYNVIGSYDPNIKEVYPPGICEPHFISNDQLLNYSVHFQNTGNAEAIHIYVLDTLDSDLNFNSVRIIGNSHPLITELLPGNVLKFRFDNILLPDSISNEPASHGFVIFEVKPLSGLTNGTQIKNDVGIYFDFNPPVYTNTVLNTINDGTLMTDGSFDNSTSTSGITITANLAGVSYQWINCSTGDSLIGATNQSYTSTQNGNYAVIISDECYSDTSECVYVISLRVNRNEDNNFISIYPNPANNSINVNTTQPTQINIVNLFGEVVINRKIQKEAVIDISELALGIYFVHTKEGIVQKLIIQK